MALKDWKKTSVGWDREGGGWIYLYPKRMFRGKEKQVVISTSLTGGSNPKDRENKGFKTKTQAIKFARNYMKKH